MASTWNVPHKLMFWKLGLYLVAVLEAVEPVRGEAWLLEVGTKDKL